MTDFDLEVERRFSDYMREPEPSALERIFVAVLVLLSFCVMSIVIWAMARFGGILLDLVDRL